MNTNILLILSLSIIGPAIGSAIGVFKKPSKESLYSALAFAAGIMISVCLFGLIPVSIRLSSWTYMLIGLFLGVIIMFACEKLIPHYHGFHHIHGPNAKLEKTALLLLIGIFLHNFPEGMAIGIGSIDSFSLSIAIAVVFAFHDIPEGICTSLPFYYSTGKKLKSFLISVSTALPTIFGFLLTYFFLKDISHQTVGLLIGGTAGLMIFMSIFELIPNAHFESRRFFKFACFFIGLVAVGLLNYL